MKFLYLAIHYPRQEHVEELLKAMRTLDAAISKAPGFVQAAAWREKDGKRILALSVWTSEELFLDAVPVIQNAIKDVPFSLWEEKPRELLRANELP
jgi:quinol monooxygenase YgiN